MDISRFHFGAGRQSADSPGGGKACVPSGADQDRHQPTWWNSAMQTVWWWHQGNHNFLKEISAGITSRMKWWLLIWSKVIEQFCKYQLQNNWGFFCLFFKSQTIKLAMICKRKLFLKKNKFSFLKTSVLTSFFFSVSPPLSFFTLSLLGLVFCAITSSIPLNWWDASLGFFLCFVCRG